MLIDLLTGHLWLTLALWAGVYIADYYLTLAGAQLYGRGVERVLAFEGSYELNPLFQQDIDGRRRISIRFLVMLGVTCMLLAFAWRGVWLRWFVPGVFQLYLGALLLTELVVLMRHVRNIAMFRQILAGADLAGQIRYPRWFALRTSATDLGLFAGFFLLLATIAAPPFFLGGALACGALALRHLRSSRRLQPNA